MYINEKLLTQCISGPITKCYLLYKSAKRLGLGLKLGLGLSVGGLGLVIC